LFLRDYLLSQIDRQFIDWLADATGTEPKTLQNKVAPGGLVKLKSLDLGKLHVDLDRPELRLLENVQFWIEQLKCNLVGKSGSASRQYRSSKGKEGLYRFFVSTIYPYALRAQLKAEPSLREAVTKPENWTRFYENIKRLIKSPNAMPPLLPPTYHTFYKALEVHGFKIYFDRTPHPCPICIRSGLLEGQVTRLQTRRKQVTTSEESAALDVLERKLQRQRHQCKVHEIQLHTQRLALENLLYREVSQTTALVYMDFVGYYCLDGSDKIRQLVFVSQFCDENEDITTRYHSVVSTDGSDASFVRRAWTILFQESKFLKKITRIYVARDNGPHFRCYENLLFESTCFQKFDKEIHVRSLPPYHAYNRCDAWGQHANELFAKLK
jgi:hypothetical protein